MDALSLVLLPTLFLGTAISLQGALASTDGCSVTSEDVNVALDGQKAGVFCHLDTVTRWAIGSDLCDLSTFTEYSSCSESLCYVSPSDYLVEGPTYVCCHGGSQRECYEIKSTPKTRHQVDPVAIAGTTGKAHTIITSKPRPPLTDMPGVIVELLSENTTFQRLNVSTELVSDPTDVTRYVAIHTFKVPSDIDLDETGPVNVRFEFTQPPDWTHLDHLVPPVIPVVRVSGRDPPAQPTGTTDPPTDSEGREDATATATCRETGIIVAMAVVSAVCIVVALVAIVCSIYCVYLQRKKQHVIKTSNSPYGDPPPYAAPSVPNHLSLTPVSPPGTTATTPGLITPMSDTSTSRLLHSPNEITGAHASSSAVTTDPANATVATNPTFQRQPSRDSNSTATTTTTPTDADRLLSVPAASPSAGSTGLGSSIESPCSNGGPVILAISPAGPVNTNMMFEAGQNYSGYPSGDGAGRDGGGGDGGRNAVTASAERLGPSSNNTVRSMQSTGSDPRFHTYATLGEVRPSGGSGSSGTGGPGGQTLPARVGGDPGNLSTYYNGGELPQSSLQLNHQTRRNYEVYNSDSVVPLPSLSTSMAYHGSVGTSSLISPAPPAADPNYSTSGRKMHLPSQYREQVNATDV